MKIHEQAMTAAKNFLICERELLRILIEVDRDRIFEQHEMTHLTPYCVKILGLSEEVANCFVRIVRKSYDVPELASAVLTGTITPYKARAIASVITPENQAAWIEKASTLSKKNLEREVAEARGQNKKPVKLDLPHETVDKLERARDILSSKRAEFASLEETIDWSLEETLHKHDPVEKARRSRGHSLKHAITERDQEQCSYIYKDGTQCDERKWLQRHHIIHRANGGPDTLENMITLCASHHRLHHRNHH